MKVTYNLKMQERHSLKLTQLDVHILQQLLQSNDTDGAAYESNKIMGDEKLNE
jgi:hypothetical protein